MVFKKKPQYGSLDTTTPVGIDDETVQEETTCWLAPSSKSTDDEHTRGAGPICWFPHVRFLVLFLMPLVPFGGHFFKSSISSLEVFMLADGPLGMDPARYGIMTSSFTVGNLFLPFFGGHYIDRVGHRKGIMVFISIVLTGQIIFTLGVHFKSYYLLLVGGVIFGSAQGNVSVTFRAVVSRYFADHEIMFAIGCTHGVACLSKMAARASAVPIKEFFAKDADDDSYIAPFYVMIGVTACSLLAAYAYTLVSPHPVSHGPITEEQELDIEAKITDSEHAVKNVHFEEAAHVTKPIIIDSTRNNEDSLLSLPQIDNSKQVTSSLPNMHRIDSFLLSLRDTVLIDGLHGLGGDHGPVIANDDKIDDKVLHEEHKLLIDNKSGEENIWDPHDPLLKMRRLPSVDCNSSTPETSSSTIISSSHNNDHTFKSNSLLDCVMEFDIKRLPSTFWFFTVLHALFLMVFHLFPSISGHFLVERHGMTPKQAGYISSFLTLFGSIAAPITGIILDKSGGQLYVIVISGILALISYGVLSFTDFPPLYSILALSLADGCIPTILHALIPLSVDASKFGVAFGISEILDGSGHIFGDILVSSLREMTGTYASSMLFIVGLTLFSTLLSVALVFHDRRENDSAFNSAFRKR